MWRPSQPRTPRRPRVVTVIALVPEGFGRDVPECVEAILRRRGAVHPEVDPVSVNAGPTVEMTVRAGFFAGDDAEAAAAARAIVAEAAWTRAVWSWRCTGTMGDGVAFTRLREPAPDVVAAMARWEADPALIPLVRPNATAAEAATTGVVNADTVAERLARTVIHLITLDGRPVGETSYQVDPPHLLRLSPGTAWVGVVIGEPEARGRGIGRRAMDHLEEAIRADGLARIELGVFAFNRNARRLYDRMGYREFARIPDFTYHEGRMWPDVRMEKWLTPPPSPPADDAAG